MTEQPTTTIRSTVPAMEELLYQEIPVLSTQHTGFNGFIRLVDYMGTDASIVQAARVSYGRGTKTTRQDEGLIRYLMKNGHTSPFEMAEIKLHIKLPIFVARQWIRHRTANVNEYSARYSVLNSEFYVPEEEHVARQSEDNKQGRGEALSQDSTLGIQELIYENSLVAYDRYEALLKQGVARELARVTLPVNYYTQWYWKIDLHNLLHFLLLRCDPHAQYEIRAYADVILHEIVKKWVPMTYQAFCDCRLNAKTFSAPEMQALRRLFQHIEMGVLRESHEGLSDREWKEFITKVGLGADEQG